MTTLMNGKQNDWNTVYLKIINLNQSLTLQKRSVFFILKDFS